MKVGGSSLPDLEKGVSVLMCVLAQKHQLRSVHVTETKSLQTNTFHAECVIGGNVTTDPIRC